MSLTQQENANESLRQCLIRISTELAELAPSLPESDRSACTEMVSIFRKSVIPQLDADFPLLVAVTGGGSVGKSTLFNTLVAAPISATNSRAGYTRRMIAAVPPRVARDAAQLNLLFERFRENARPRQCASPEEALTPGDPVYTECPTIPERLVLVDTPDFDTGTAEGFTNRDAATEILSVSDVILYIVTNQLYNNRDASLYLRRILAEIGVKKIALLYRCFPAITEDEVREHMSVALSNLYPDERMAKEACLGIWRIDESNDVAAGACPPEIRPLEGGISLREALEALDPTKTRAKIMRDAIDDGLRVAEKWLSASEAEAGKLEAYRDALRFMTSATCRQCLELVPQRDILRVFSDEWEAAQPWLVRNGHYLSRGTGKMLKAVRGVFSKKKNADPGPGFAASFKTSFLEKVRVLQGNVESPVVQFEFPKGSRDLQPLVGRLGELAQTEPDAYQLTDMAPGRGEGTYHATVRRPQFPGAGQTGADAAGDRLVRMAERAAAVMGDTESVRPGIREFVKSIRNNMSVWQSAKEWFGASLETVAVAGAVSYVVCTGDFVSGGTAMSMFGLNDLIAVPALGTFIAAHGKIDSKLAERQMQELFTTWAKGKEKEILAILEECLVGAPLAACDAHCKKIGEHCKELQACLKEARECFSLVF